MKRVGMIMLALMWACICTAAGEGTLALPENITAVHDEAFMNDASIERVVIPRGALSIGNRAFAGCEKLTDAIVPESVHQIGSNAFDKDTVIWTQSNTIAAQWAKINGNPVRPFPEMHFSCSNTDAQLGAPVIWSVNAVPGGCECEWEISCDGTVEYRQKRTDVSVFSITYLPTRAGTWSAKLILRSEGRIIAEISAPNAVISEKSPMDAKNFTYSIRNGGVYITGYKGNEPNLIVPKSIGSMPVVSVRIHENSLLKTILLPEDGSIADIRIGMCPQLTAVNIPGSVKMIGENALSDNPLLNDITIRNGVTEIGPFAFSNCQSLRTVTIPASVKTVGINAFYQCAQLRVVEFAQGSPVTALGDMTFNGCSQLKTLILPEGLTSVSAIAFSPASVCRYCCCPVDSVTADTLRKLGYTFRDSAFPDFSLSRETDADGKAYLTIIGYSGGAEAWIPGSIRGIPVTMIGENAFAGNAAIVKLSLPAELKTIKAYAFSGCENLAEVAFAENSCLAAIESDAFRDCDSLKEVFLPDSLSDIGEYAFYGIDTFYCHAGSAAADFVSTGWAYADIGDASFFIDPDYPAYTLRQYADGDNNPTLTIMSDSAASGDYTVPASIRGVPVTGIGEYAYRMKPIERLTIHKDITSIGTSAFYFCDKMTDVTFEEDSKFANLGNSIFAYCSAVKHVYCHAGSACSVVLSEYGTWFNDPLYPDLRLRQYTDKSGRLYLIVSEYTGSEASPTYPTDIRGVPVRVN